MTPKLTNITKEDWRQLGYFYYRDDVSKKWIFAGSPYGLGNFVLDLKKYVEKPSHDRKSEHEHYGPYLYLEIMTWDSPGIDNHSIHGSLYDLLRLANILESKLDEKTIGQIITVSDEYSLDCKYSMELHVKEYGFDPALEDKQLWE